MADLMGLLYRSDDHGTVELRRILPVAPADLWSELTDPERLAEALEIAEVATEQGAIGGSGETRVQLLAPEATLPRVVDAQVKDARITLVPAHGVR